VKSEGSIDMEFKNLSRYVACMQEFWPFLEINFFGEMFYTVEE